MDETVIIGIDGGQTKTACLVGRPDGTLLSVGYGGTAALMSAPDPRNLMQEALGESLGAAVKKLKKIPEKALAAYLGLTGGTEWALEILPQILPCERIQAESDTLAALASGTYGGPGVVLLSGTGAIALAKTASGEQFIHGGYGYLLGDEGSGFWLGREIIAGAIHFTEGRGLSSSVFPEMLRRLGVSDTRQLAAEIYEGRISRKEIAALVPLLFVAYQEGDPFAVQLIQRAAGELSALAVSVCCRAGMEDPTEKRLVFAGGVLHKDSPVAIGCEVILRRELPGFQLIHPQLPPVAGAFILALKLANIEISSRVLENIHKSCSQVISA